MATPTLIDGEGKANDANGNPSSKLKMKSKLMMSIVTPCFKLMAKAKPKMPMATLAPIHNEDKVEDGDGDPHFKLMAKAKPKMSMAIPLFPIDGEGKLKDANGDP